MKVISTKEDILSLKHDDKVLMKRRTMFQMYRVKIPYSASTPVAILHMQESGGIGAPSLEELYNRLVRSGRI